jgi:hypothetical protein
MILCRAGSCSHVPGVAPGTLPRIHPCRRRELEPLVGAELNAPPTGFVDQMMVMRAQQKAVCLVGIAAVEPAPDMMNVELAPVWRTPSQWFW